MNNKGFTLVELISSFTLALIIMFFLFQIVIAVKEIYVSSGLKTEMLIKQANMERKIGTDLKEQILKSVTRCGDECYTFLYNDNTSKNLSVDRSKKAIVYGDYQIEMLDGSSIGTFQVSKNTISGVEAGKNDTILTIDIPVKNKVLADRNFGVHMIYQYNSRTTNLGL